MIELKAPFEDHSIPCPTGDGTAPEFEYDENGELVFARRVDTDAVIQSHKEECDIGYLLARSLNGDSSALDQRIGQYIDTVDLPDNLADAIRAGEAGSAALNTLSEEQKELLKKGDSEGFIKTFEVKPEDEKAKLVARLQELTGKEVKIDE